MPDWGESPQICVSFKGMQGTSVGQLRRRDHFGANLTQHNITLCVAIFDNVNKITFLPLYISYYSIRSLY